MPGTIKKGNKKDYDSTNYMGGPEYGRKPKGPKNRIGPKPGRPKPKRRTPKKSPK